MNPLRLLLFACFLVVAIPPLRVSIAQIPASHDAPSMEKDAEPDLEKKRTESEKRLRMAQRILRSASSNGEQPPERLAEDVKSRKQLDLFVAQQQVEQERQKDLASAKAELAAKLESLRTAGPAEEEPLSFLLLDQLRDQLAEELAEAENVAVASNSRRNSLRAAWTDGWVSDFAGWVDWDV